MMKSLVNTPWHLLWMAHLLLLAPWCQADIRVVLKEPQWEFLLHNAPSGNTQAQLTPVEASFSRAIQPLLAKQDSAAVMQAFAGRDINSDSPALRQLRGQVLLSMKRYDEAEKALRAALQAMPDLALAHRSLSMVYLMQRRYDQAKPHLQRTIEMGVADAQVYGQLAFVNLQLGQAASAVAGYQYALLLEADNGQWQQGLLYALIQAQALDQAQALLDDMLQKDFNNPDLWLQRGQIALKQGRHLQAIASIETALQLGEDRLDNIATAAQLHIHSGSPRRAVALLGKHMNSMLTGGDRSQRQVVDQIAAWLVSQADWANLQTLLTAVDAAGEKLHSQERSRFAVYHAQWAIAQGKTKVARKQLEHALDHNPTDGEALLQLATLLQQHHQNDRAVLYYVRAEALDEFRERAQLGRAQLEIDQQNYKEALRLLRLVAVANPARSDLLANIQSLENLVRQQG